MIVNLYDNTVRFRDAVLPFLSQREAENNLMISILLRLADGSGRWGDESPLCCTVSDRGQVVAAALQTPPHHLQLTRMEAAAIASLVKYFRATGKSLPGVLGPMTTARAFAECWTAGTTLQADLQDELGVYQLEHVKQPVSPGGYAELATAKDTELLIDWMNDFISTTGLEHQESAEIVRNALMNERFFLWKDPLPVSLAAYCGPTPHGMRINSVYTPPSHRGKGYALANVAALSQHLLDTGRTFCYLFTDLANPTSNGIYRKIGYQRVCDFATLRFVER